MHSSSSYRNERAAPRRYKSRTSARARARAFIYLNLLHTRAFKWFGVASVDSTVNTNDPRRARAATKKRGEKKKGRKDSAKLYQIGVTGNFATCPCKIYRFIYMLPFGSCRALIPTAIDELFIKRVPLLRRVFRLIVRLFLVCCPKRRDARIKLAHFFRVSSKSGMNIKISRRNSRRVYSRIGVRPVFQVTIPGRRRKGRGKIRFYGGSTLPIPNVLLRNQLQCEFRYI